ncbi:MAG: phosphoribosylanthranilate isomerase [Planctomycetota bacterium]|jgi:phosphoribosylanthranilate isomerase
MTQIKICCISSVIEAELAVGCGASAIGLVSAMPSGPGVITEEEIAEIAQAIRLPIASFLLTSSQRSEEIVAQQKRCFVNTIQLCDAVNETTIQDLRRNLPGISLVQVIHVQGKESVEEARQAADLVDAILLDSGNQSLQIKELGGTGRVHDWDVSAQIVDQVNRPVFLAGGLNAENVAESIKQVQPFGVDICSGVRTKGALDPEKLRKFIDQVHSASA